MLKKESSFKWRSMKCFLLMLVAMFLLAACDEPNNTPVSSVTIENGSDIYCSVKEHDVLLLTAKVLPDNASYKTVKWSSSDEGIARVTGEGYVIGVKEGEVTITASVGEVNDSLKLYVVPQEAGYMLSADEEGVLTYHIWNEAGLNAWREYVVKNTGTEDAPFYGNLDTNAILMDNITLTAPEDVGGSNWSPIGNSDNYYKGTFDGNGMTISNLIIKTPEQSYIGFFGYIGDYAVVKNVTFSDVEFVGKGLVGGVTGFNLGGSIDTCNVSGTIDSNGMYVGGIVGCNNGGSIEECVVEVDISSSSSNVGGIVGSIFNKGNVTSCRYEGDIVCTNYGSGYNMCVGGIVGCNGGNIKDCNSTARIITSQYMHVGGIVGHNKNNSTIDNCSVDSDISCTGGMIVGGIAGYNEGGSIKNCCVGDGSLSGVSSVGGIVGWNKGEIIYCHSKIGIKGDDTVVYFGGIAGYNFNGIIIACSNTGTISAVTGEKLGGIAGENSASIIACYSTGAFSIGNNENTGGIAGLNNAEAEIIACYSLGSVSSDSTESTGTIKAGYWFKNTENNPSLGVGQGGSNGVNEVDGVDMTWISATADMNRAIGDWNTENQDKCNYHFEQVDGDDNPPVLVEGAPSSAQV